MSVIITGVAGFIGFHLACRLIKDGQHVIGIDSLPDDTNKFIRDARLRILQEEHNFSFHQYDIAVFMDSNIFKRIKDATCIVHLAAQSGIRCNKNADDYIQSNIVGFTHLLEYAKESMIPIIYASSSAVYGTNNTHSVNCENDLTDNPCSLYAATKKSNEIISETYNHLYNMSIIGLRLFTVYGPWGRPDMALFKWAYSISQGNHVELYNHGKYSRDFTYIDDVIECIIRLMQTNRNESFYGKHVILNVGSGVPSNIVDCLKLIEHNIGTSAQVIFSPPNKADVMFTCADTSRLMLLIGYTPTTPLHEGIKMFTYWFQEYIHKYNCYVK